MRMSSKRSSRADGRDVSFTTYASNMVVGDTNEVSDIFVRGPLYPKTASIVSILNLLLE